MEFELMARQVLAGSDLSVTQCHDILACPDEQILSLLQAAYRLRYRYFKNEVHIQQLNNAKSGHCGEDCHYCAQSQAARTVPRGYGLKAGEQILQEALTANRQGQLARYCMALSGGRVTDQDVDTLCGIIAEIKRHASLPLCCSLGFLTTGQARRLKAAGLDRVNHNLNTGPRYYPQICTTHTYGERVANIKTCQAAGLEICSGGIVGQGETEQDIIDMFQELQALNVDSVPVNFFVPIPGTPFGEQTPALTPLYCLKILCLARFLHPQRELRVAAGREMHLRSLQPLMFFIVNSVFIEGYLTTAGQSRDETLVMIYDAGFKVVGRNL